MASENEVVIEGKFETENIKKGVEDTETWLKRIKDEADANVDGIEEIGEAAGNASSAIEMAMSAMGLGEAAEGLSTVLTTLESIGVSAGALAGIGVVVAGATALWQDHVAAIERAEKAYDDYVKKSPNSQLGRDAKASGIIVDRERFAGVDEEDAEKNIYRAGRAAQGLTEEYTNSEKFANIISAGGYGRGEYEDSMIAGREALAGVEAQRKADEDLIARQKAEAEEAKIIAQQDKDMDRGQARLEAQEERERMAEYKRQQAEEERRLDQEEKIAMQQGRQYLKDREELEKAESKRDKMLEDFESQQEMRAASKMPEREKQFQSSVTDSFDAVYSKIAIAAASSKTDPAEEAKKQREEIAKRQEELRIEQHRKRVEQQDEVIRLLREKQPTGLA